MRLTFIDQKLPPGLHDDSVEFYVFQNEVHCLHAGIAYTFDSMPQHIIDRVEHFMMQRPEALKALKDWGIWNADDMLRQFIFCYFGAFDGEPDITSNGEFSQAEYFDCGRRGGECPYEGKLCGSIKVANGYLTKQEINILKLIAQGKLNKEIADILNISEETVSSHNQNISIKTGKSRKPELSVLAYQKNLI